MLRNKLISPRDILQYIKRLPTVYGVDVFGDFDLKKCRNLAIFGQIWFNLVFKRVIFWFCVTQRPKVQLEPVKSGIFVIIHICILQRALKHNQLPL